MRSICLICACVGVVGAFAQSCCRLAAIGFPRQDAAVRLRTDFKNPPPGYGEVPFWWWTGDRLDKARLLEQIDALHRAGVSGMQINYAHTRSGEWRTADVEPSIFSDDWWDIFNFVAEESAKRGMGVGLSGYTIDWPGNDNLFRKLGISADDTRARRLQVRCVDAKGGLAGPFTDADIVSVAAFSKKGDGAPILLSATGGELPEGDWQIRITAAPPAARTLDPLNPESAKRVIARFLDPFEKRLSPLGRSALNYFFQDELRLGGDLRLWSADFPQEFRKRKGYDILPWVSALAMDAGAMTDKVRLDANDVMVELTGERYFEPIYTWHASRGLIYACDPASRGRNPVEFGDYMRSMRWYSAPGFDTPGTSADVVKNKVGSSIAHLYRRPRVWLEGYHSQGWQAAAATIFDSTVHNFVYGSSLLNLHGLYYSTYGGWWEWAPPCYHFRMPYWRHMPTYLKYFERLSYILSQGVHVADVAVLNPLEPLIVDRGRGAAAVKLSQGIVTELVTRRSVDVDFIDGDSVLRSEFKNGRLCVAGEQYRVIVLPDMFALRANVLRKLVAFRKAGGCIAAFGRLPSVTDTPPAARAQIEALVKELAPVCFAASPKDADYARLVSLVGTPDFAGPAGTKVLHRRIGDYDVYFLVDLKSDATCTFRVDGMPETWNPWTGEMMPVEDWHRNGDGTTRVTLEGGPQPTLLVFVPTSATNSTGRAKASRRAAIPLDGPWRFSLVPTLDNKWGDYRLPATKELIGAEIRRFRTDLQDGEKGATVGFAPQFRVAGTNRFHAFSWRWGEETHPAFQDWHHGLNRRVGNDFFTLGNYDMGLYDVAPKAGEQPTPVVYETFVVVPESCSVKLVAHGVAPSAIELDGQACTTNDVMRLDPGARRLSVRYAAFGRAALVVRRTDIPSRPSKTPLSMCWYDDPAVLRFDPFGGTIRETRFTATVPPGFQSARLELEGELIAATCAGQPAQIRRGGGFAWDISMKDKVTRGGELVLVIRPKSGVVGCGVFRGPVKLACGVGEIALGDWARFDGLACYSGGAVYEKEFTLSAEQAKQASELDLGQVAETCDVTLNGGAAQVLCTPPWKVDVRGQLREGRNVLRVRVFNTLNNHYQTIPTRYKRPVRDVPSGLLGPVRLITIDQ